MTPVRRLESRWQRPRTTKLYVHPPRAERMITLWPDWKVVNSVVGRDVRQGTEGHGCIWLEGTQLAHVPWERTRIHVREDGIPIHTLEYTGEDGLEYCLECFCSMDRRPDVYMRMAVPNRNGRSVAAALGLLPRTGRESNMMGMHSDGYASYEPTLAAWEGLTEVDWYGHTEVLDAAALANLVFNGHFPAQAGPAWRNAAGALFPVPFPSTSGLNYV